MTFTFRTNSDKLNSDKLNSDKLNSDKTNRTLSGSGNDMSSSSTSLQCPLRCHLHDNCRDCLDTSIGGNGNYSGCTNVLGSGIGQPLKGGWLILFKSRTLFRSTYRFLSKTLSNRTFQIAQLAKLDFCKATGSVLAANLLVGHLCQLLCYLIR